MIADQMGAFTTHDIGGALLSVLAAGLIGGLGALLAGAQDRMRLLAALAALVAFGVLLVRGSVPLAIAFVGIAIVLAPRDAHGQGLRGDLLRLMAALAGLGCGAGATIIAALLVLPVSLLLRWAHTKDK